MDVVKKVTTVGTSLCIVIDKVIADSLKIKKGSWVKVKIKKLKGGA